MKKKRVPIIILSNKSRILGLDYINKKIVYLICQKELEAEKVYLTDIKKIKSKRGEWSYTIELHDDKAIGNCDLTEFIIKCQLMNYNIESTFDEIINYNDSKNSMHIVRFSNSKLETYKDKAQLKMDNVFVNMDTNIEGISKNIRNNYIGYVLIEKILLPNSKFDIYNGLEIFGYFIDKQKKESKISTKKNNLEIRSNFNPRTYDLKSNYDIKFHIGYFRDYEEILYDMTEDYIVENDSKNTSSYNMLRNRELESDTECYNLNYSDEITYEPNLDDELGNYDAELFNEYRASESSFNYQMNELENNNRKYKNEEFKEVNGYLINDKIAKIKQCKESIYYPLYSTDVEKVYVEPIVIDLGSEEDAEEIFTGGIDEIKINNKNYEKNLKKELKRDKFEEEYYHIHTSNKNIKRIYNILKNNNQVVEYLKVNSFLKFLYELEIFIYSKKFRNKFTSYIKNSINDIEFATNYKHCTYMIEVVENFNINELMDVFFDNISEIVSDLEKNTDCEFSDWVF